MKRLFNKKDTPSKDQAQVRSKPLAEPPTQDPSAPSDLALVLCGHTDCPLNADGACKDSRESCPKRVTEAVAVKLDIEHPENAIPAQAEAVRAALADNGFSLIKTIGTGEGRIAAFVNPFIQGRGDDPLAVELLAEHGMICASAGLIAGGVVIRDIRVIPVEPEIETPEEESDAETKS